MCVWPPPYGVAYCVFAVESIAVGGGDGLIVLVEWLTTRFLRIGDERHRWRLANGLR